MEEHTQGCNLPYISGCKCNVAENQNADTEDVHFFRAVAVDLLTQPWADEACGDQTQAGYQTKLGFGCTHEDDIQREVRKHQFIAEAFQRSTDNCYSPCRLLRFPEGPDIQIRAFFC